MTAELWALPDGLSLCLQLLSPCVEVELDAQVVVTLLTNSSIVFWPGIFLKGTK
jgi:hypothetical protein